MFQPPLNFHLGLHELLNWRGPSPTIQIRLGWKASPKHGSPPPPVSSATNKYLWSFNPPSPAPQASSKLIYLTNRYLLLMPNRAPTPLISDQIKWVYKDLGGCWGSLLLNVTEHPFLLFQYNKCFIEH